MATTCVHRVDKNACRSSDLARRLLWLCSAQHPRNRVHHVGFPLRSTDDTRRPYSLTSHRPFAERLESCDFDFSSLSKVSLWSLHAFQHARGRRTRAKRDGSVFPNWGFFATSQPGSGERLLNSISLKSTRLAVLCQRPSRLALQMAVRVKMYHSDGLCKAYSTACLWRISHRHRAVLCVLSPRSPLA